MKYEDIIREVSRELLLPEELVNKTYKAYWLSIKEMILELPLKDNISEEEFLQLKTNFNIPSLGKLSCTQERFINMKKRFEYIKKLRQNGTESKVD